MNTQIQNSQIQFSSNQACARAYADSALAYSRGQNPSVRYSLTTSGWLLGLNGVHLGEDMRLYPGPNTVGSSARSNIVVTAPETGRQHAVIDVLSGESAIVYPGSSHRPLFVNDSPCEMATPLCHGDTLQIGDQLFAFIALLPVPANERKIIQLRERLHPKVLCTVGWLVELNTPDGGRDYRLFPGENRIGGQPGLEVFLPHADIRARHCVITRHPENWTIVPVSVSDPLFVNGVPSTGCGLENGDILTLGQSEFLFRSIKVGFVK